jgi:hypothetical protein
MPTLNDCVLLLNHRRQRIFYVIILRKTKLKAETGNCFKVTISDNQYYSNQLRIITYETDDFNKGKNYRLQASMTLSGKVFSDVYYWKQERRPFEIYIPKLRE